MLVTRAASLARPAAVMLLSAATLAYEILLVRVFAIEHFHHFAYMAIGIAMLGFGAAGTLLALVPPLPRSQAERLFVWAAIATALALVASPALTQRVEMDLTQLAWSAEPWRRLALVYLLLAIPFAIGALATLLALIAAPERPGRVYGASFLGAGLGAALALAILWAAFPARALAMPAFVAALGAVVALLEQVRLARAVATMTALAAAALSLANPPWALELSPYKSLPQVEAFPDARRVAERTSPVGWVVAVQAPAFRHAPGLSLGYTGDFPRQTALFVDGQIVGAATEWRSAEEVALLGWLPSAAPYALEGRERVLVLGAGGGMEAATASAHGARTVTAVELHPEIARLARELSHGPHTVGERAEAETRIIVSDVRRYAAETSELFDLVTLGVGGGFGSASAGLHALNEDFLHTVEAYVGYLARLSDRGVLAITWWLAMPPRTSVRLILTAAEALRRTDPASVDRGLIVLRSWGTVTVLVKPAGFTELEVDGVDRWAAARQFDLDWHPALAEPRSVFNLLDEPTLFRAARAATTSQEAAARFADAYPFEVAPVTDARPYAHHFLRASSLPSLLREDRGGWLPFAEWSYIALVATLAQSIVLAGVLLLLPVALRFRSPPIAPRLPIVGYFSAIGLAYLAAEIAAIQQLALLLGHPVYAVAAVLAAFLICSGMGSVWSDRFLAARGWRVTAAIAVILAAYAALLLSIVHVIQPAPLAARIGAAILLLAPLAFLMGMPFPLGLRLLAVDGSGVGWAWAANGFSSVVAAPLSALVALEAGSPALFLVAGLAYAGAAAVATRPLRGRGIWHMADG